MGRWLTIWLRNRIAATVALGIAVTIGGGVAIGCYRLLGDPLGMWVGGIASFGALYFIATHPWLSELAERMAAEERNAYPRPRI